MSRPEVLAPPSETAGPLPVIVVAACPDSDRMLEAQPVGPVTPVAMPVETGLLMFAVRTGFSDARGADRRLDSLPSSELGTSP